MYFSPRKRQEERPVCACERTSMGNTISVLAVERQSRQSKQQIGAKSLPTVRVVTRRRSSLERLFGMHGGRADETSQKGEAGVVEQIEGRDTAALNRETCRYSPRGNGNAHEHTEHRVSTRVTADMADAASSSPSSSSSSSLAGASSSSPAPSSGCRNEIRSRGLSECQHASLRAGGATSSSPRSYRLRSHSTSSLPGGGSEGMRFYQQILGRQLRNMSAASATASGSSSPRSHASSPVAGSPRQSGASTPLGITVVRRDSYDENGNLCSHGAQSPSGSGTSGSPRGTPCQRGRWFQRLFNGRRHSTGNLQSVRIRSSTSGLRIGGSNGNANTTSSSNNSTSNGNGGLADGQASSARTGRTLFHHQNIQQRVRIVRTRALPEDHGIHACFLPLFIVIAH